MIRTDLINDLLQKFWLLFNLYVSGDWVNNYQIKWFNDSVHSSNLLWISLPILVGKILQARNSSNYLEYIYYLKDTRECWNVLSLTSISLNY